MAINITKHLIAAGIGAGDVALVRNDATSGRTAPFKKYSDIARVVVFGVGLAMQVIIRGWSVWGENLSVPVTPLLMHSLADAAMPVAGRASGAFVPRMTGRGVAQTTKPEFEGKRIY